VLHLIQKYQRVLIVVQVGSRHGAQLDIEVFCSSHITKQTFAFIVFHKVDFYKIREQPFADFSNDVGLPNLSGALYDEYFVIRTRQMLLYIGANFSLQHDYQRLKYVSTRQIYTFQ
jgi:hypothetical protein